MNAAKLYCAMAALAAVVAGTTMCFGQDVPSFVISTIAGADAAVDGQSVFRVPLFGAQDLAADSAGNLYVAECSGNRVRKLAGGKATTYAGIGLPGFTGDGGPAIAARLNCPGSLTFDPAGNLYFVDGSERIRRVTPEGVINTYVRPDSATLANGNLIWWVTTSLATDGAGNLYFSIANTIRKAGPDGRVTTIAGVGTPGFGGDGGPAGAALLNSPFDLAFDSKGSLFIADRDNHRIRKIAPDGTITTASGSGQPGNSGDGGPATQAQISFPSAIAFDAGGNLFISSGGQLRKVTPAGVITTHKPVWLANGLAFSLSDGYLYGVSGGQIIGTGPSGATGILVDGPRPPGTGLTAANAAVMNPRALAVDASGNVLYVDQFFRQITEITAAGLVDLTVAVPQPSWWSVAVAPSRDVFYVNGNQVFKVDRRTGRDILVAGQEQAGYSGDGGMAVAAQFRNPAVIAFDPAGNLYISDYFNYRIRKVTTDGVISTIAGDGIAGDSGDGGPALSARFNGIYCLAADTSGALYACDNGRIRKIDAAGMVSTIAGNTSISGLSRDGLGAKGNPLFGAVGVAVDGKGNVYIAEQASHRIRIITPDGRLHTAAGTGVSGSEGDGGPARDAKLFGPAGVAIDAAGNLYVSDTGNHRIRKLTLNQPRRIEIVNGDAQSGATGGCLSPLRVKITGSAGVGVEGVRVDFAVTQGSASVAASATTGTDGVAAAAIELGAGAGPVDVRASAAGLPAVSFHLTALAGGDALTPCLAPAGVVSAGLSPAPLRSLSLGALASAFGQKFTDPGAGRGITTEDIQTGTLPAKLAGVCVMVGGVAAPLLYAGEGQVNFQVPGAAPGESVPVQVVRNCGTAGELRSNQENVTVRSASPELLALVHNAEGGNPVAAIGASNQMLIADPASAAGLAVRPAQAGDILTMFAIGLGRTDSPLAPGALAVSAARVTDDVRVEIRSSELDPADVLYAGVTPGFAGLYQISFLIPERFRTHMSIYGYVPIAVRIGNALSPDGTYLFMDWLKLK